MTIPFRELTDEDKEIIRIEAKRNKKKCVIFVISGVLIFILCVISAIVEFCNFEGGIAILLILVGILFGGVFVLVGSKSNKPVTGICKVTVVDKEVERRYNSTDQQEFEDSFYLTFSIPGTEEQLRKNVDSSYYKRAEKGGEAYLLKVSGNNYRVYVPSKKEKKSIKEEIYEENLKKKIDEDAQKDNFSINE